MPTTLAAQLAALELGHLSIASDPGARPLARPEPEAIDQTLAAVWSDLFALFTDTILEDQAEELGWGFVNLFHRAAAKASTRIDRATDEIRLLLATNDGSEVHTAELEQQVERAQAAEGEMLALEALRETAAALYLAETGSSWKPAGGSRLSHDALSTSAVVQGREFLKARAEGKRRAAMPEGTPVVFAGGRLSSAARTMPRPMATRSGARSTGCAPMSPTWSSSMAAMARVPTGSRRPGPSVTRYRRSRSVSTPGSALGQASAATSRCSG